MPAATPPQSTVHGVTAAATVSPILMMLQPTPPGLKLSQNDPCSLGFAFGAGAGAGFGAGFFGTGIRSEAPQSRPAGAGLGRRRVPRLDLRLLFLLRRLLGLRRFLGGAVARFQAHSEAGRVGHAHRV